MNNGIEGDVQSRMDAFRGNPQALAQRYAQDQQLIDLLALQKLKSEKDAAARQMQMQAGQGQMPTIAQQREQELMGMAKQEVAQRVGAVGQQQAQQQQKNLQQAMQGGIAQAPAPNMMPPQAMASGGIVAFADGGDTGTKSIEQLRKEYDDARASGDFQEASRLFKVIKARSEMAPRTVTVPVAEMGIPQAAPTPPQAAPAQVPPGAPPGQRPAGAVPAPGGAGLGSIALPGAGAGAMPAGAPQGQGAPQAQGQAAQQPAQPSGLQAGLEDYLARGLKSDPEAAAAAERAAYAKQIDPLYQQQRELSQQGIAQLQQRMAQQPKKDPISEFLRGMSTQRTLGMALGAGGAGITAAQRANFEQQAELEDQLQKLRETGLGAQITQEKEKYGAGDKRRTEALGLGEKAATVAGPYLSQLSNAEARQLVAQAQLEARERIAATNIDEKTKAAYASAVKAQVANLIKEMGVRANFGDGKVEFETKKKQIQEDLAQLFNIPLATTSAPAAGPAIPPPPAGAVRPKGAK